MTRHLFVALCTAAILLMLQAAILTRLPPRQPKLDACESAAAIAKITDLNTDHPWRCAAPAKAHGEVVGQGLVLLQCSCPGDGVFFPLPAPRASTPAPVGGPSMETSGPRPVIAPASRKP